MILGGLSNDDGDSNEKKVKKQTKYLLANRILMSSLFDQGLFDNQRGTGFGSGVNGHYVQPPLGFLTSHMNSQAMRLPFVSIARS